MAETRINTECFLPVWEGVSPKMRYRYSRDSFPPYMGGCIIEFNFLSAREGFQEVFSMSWKDKAIIFFLHYF